MRIFLDTNVLASGIATRGLCSELLESILGEHELLICEPVLGELQRVLAVKFRMPETLAREFIDMLKTEGVSVSATGNLALQISDAEDGRILACAAVARPDFIVTGDRELLDPGTVNNIPVISPRQLWLKLAGLG